MKLCVTLIAGCAVLVLLTPLLPLADSTAVHLPRALQTPTLDIFIEHGEPRPTWSGPVAAPLATLREALFGDAQFAPLLGTDALGRCLLARIFVGARVSLLLALVASVASLSIGALWGAVAGMRGGRTDQLLMRGADVIGALPLIFMVIFAVALLRAWRGAHTETWLDQGAVLLCITAAVSWIPTARMVRAEVMSLRNATFVDAARIAGCSNASILRRHLLPNAAPVALASWTISVPRILVLESFLSFLGLGVEAPGVSWGVLLRQGYDALTAVHVSWWLILFPATALAAVLLLLGALGENLRIRLLPQQARGTP
ncbi:MAG: ABC transporter permease [Planctomycetes bacterium]|nr:ABC transporter permease [Planctomycetota bacterium]